MKKPLPEREQEMLDLIQSLKAQLVERGNVIHFQKLKMLELQNFLLYLKQYTDSSGIPEEMDCMDYCLSVSSNQTPKEPNQNEPVSTPETNGNRRPQSTGIELYPESPDEFSGSGGPQERTQLQTQSNSSSDTHDTSGDSAIDKGGTT